jgi:maltose alpha-D-glucosyltransferase/alpha-amylase
VNVRAQREDPASFPQLDRARDPHAKEWPEFGWGSWRLLATRSRETLAHLVTWDGGSALAVHNFADRPSA